MPKELTLKQFIKAVREYDSQRHPIKRGGTKR
jgi:hypothetical protein